MRVPKWTDKTMWAPNAHDVTRTWTHNLLEETVDSQKVICGRTLEAWEELPAVAKSIFAASYHRPYHKSADGWRTAQCETQPVNLNKHFKAYNSKMLHVVKHYPLHADEVDRIWTVYGRKKNTCISARACTITTVGTAIMENGA